ncbi:helix-hairpin-helix domain-containing protein [Halorubrum vacuolatum]|uniref:Helix-hairpin-helix domain-containing protein n=1 Tax=Halorubrum vacuolatum TaxID=63740 RepID=A0A238WLR2_HALVU|nr:helix-hairpin-helix domain-containing protein [Halorubrum vacuolatum]SNR47243.1 hypothetical protein SAMN06264855_108115 [Halorubrum vacuolatum]
MEYAELMSRVQASLQRGVETVERSRLDREGETRVYLSVESVDVEIPVRPETQAGTEAIRQSESDAGDLDELGVTPGEGDGRLRFSFVPSKVGELDPSPRLPLSYLQGIGEATAERLRRAGVEDVRDLARRDPRAVAVETGLSEARTKRFIDMARHVKLGADSQLAEALVRLNIDRRTLAATPGEELKRTVREAEQKGELSLPQQYRIDDSMLDAVMHRAERTSVLSGDVPERVLEHGAVRESLQTERFEDQNQSTE